MKPEEILGEASQVKILKGPDTPPTEHSVSSIPIPGLPSSPLPGAALVREQPLAPCGPAPLLLSVPCFHIWHPVIMPFLAHLPLPPTGTLNYHDGHGHIRDFTPHLFWCCSGRKILRLPCELLNLTPLLWMP